MALPSWKYQQENRQHCKQYCRLGNVRENLIFAKSLPREFKVLANIVLDSYLSNSNSHSRIQEIAYNSELKNSRNKGNEKISESTVLKTLTDCFSRSQN